jgi:hypothetical protein
MFKTMLPGPLKSLHFTKLDLGPVPITFSNVTVSRTEADGIKIEMNVSWLGQCSIGLDAPMIPDLVCHILGTQRTSTITALTRV